MELLAPAGNFENFKAAVEEGADSVYVGAPSLNARTLVREFSLAELNTMIQSAHESGVKVFVALNSLIREVDLPLLLKTLAFLESMSPDALIVQDLGLIRLVHTYFPTLKMHGSTLMTVHNRDGAQLLNELGCSRVVLARELTMKEISSLVEEKDIEIEVFIHGAMCFSYSGLCLFSSFHGGKSGLRGKCVQPCRRKFSTASSKHQVKTSNAGSGYLFSMNDLSGLELVPELMKMGVDSLKIEGRLRSETYVRNIVKAYRLVIDADEESRAEVIKEASLLVNEAMGRRISSGYFHAPRPRDAIVRHQSGNIGSYLGRIESIKPISDRLYGSITLKNPCQIGERIRVHIERTGERLAFTLAEIKDENTIVKNAPANKKVLVLLPKTFKQLENNKSTIELYRVDTVTPKKNKKTGSLLVLKPTQLSKHQSASVNAKIARINKKIFSVPTVTKQKTTKLGRKRHKTWAHKKSELWLRADTPELILAKSPFNPDRYVLNINKKMISNIGQIKKHLGRNIRSAIWALPPVIHDARIRSVEKQITLLMKTGFRAFQIAHLSQLQLFVGQRVHLYGDYTLNLLNSQSINLAAETGLIGAQLSIEIDKRSLQNTLNENRSQGSAENRKSARAKRLQLGLSVYGTPALFTSRISADSFSSKRILVSPKNEQFFVENQDGYTLTRSKKPFSLLPYKQELQQVGLDYLVVDLSGMKLGKKEMTEINDRLQNKKKMPKLPTFNYLGTLE